MLGVDLPVYPDYARAAALLADTLVRGSAMSSHEWCMGSHELS